MHRAFWRIASCALGLVAAGCFDFDATTADGPLGGDGGGAPPTTDAGFDATLPSGQKDAAAEAQADATPDDAVAPTDGSFCATAPRYDGGIFYCADFDEGQLPGSWQTWAQTLGTLVETDASAVSPPNSVVETTNALTSASPRRRAAHAARRPQVPSTLTFSFSIEPVQIDTTGERGHHPRRGRFLDDAGSRYSVGLSINVASGLPALALGEQAGLASGGNFPDGAPPTFINHPLSQTSPLAIGAMVTATIGSTGRPRARRKSVRQRRPELDTPLSFSVVPASLQVGIGTSYVTEYDAGRRRCGSCGTTTSSSRRSDARLVNAARNLIGHPRDTLRPRRSFPRRTRR